MLKHFAKALLAIAMVAVASPALAATLYISEFANGVSQVGSTLPEVAPQPVIADQNVALSGATASSAAFNAKTHVVSLICDEGCSISFGSAPTAATTNLLLQQGVTYLFGVSTGMKVAAIANAAGNTGGSGGSTVDQGTTPWIVAGSGTAGSAATGVVTIQGIAGGTLVPTSNATQLPAALGQTTMAASLPVAIASNQSAVPTSNSTQLPAGLGQTTMSASLPVTLASNQSALAVSTSDPCTSAAKSSAAISVTSGTTTSLVGVSGSTTVYVCGFAITIAPSAVTAATALFEYGTGATCTSPTSLTGTFGNGDLTAATGVAPVVYGGGTETVFKSAASAGICILTAGNAVSVQGVLTYVQQ